MKVEDDKFRSKPQCKGRLPLSKKGCENCPVVGSTQMVILQQEIRYKTNFKMCSDMPKYGQTVAVLPNMVKRTGTFLQERVEHHGNTFLPVFVIQKPECLQE